MATEKEVFKNVIGYEGLYQISNYGNIKSFKRIDVAILKPIKDSCGYLGGAFYKNRIRKQYILHRLVAEAFIPNPLNKRTVNHIDGNKLNNHVSNLEWNTDSENQNHAIRTGLKLPVIVTEENKRKCSERSKGEKNNSAKLTEQQVIKIKTQIALGVALTCIARTYKISIPTISAIKTGRLWKHIN